MKKAIAIIILGLLWCNNAVALEKCYVIFLSYIKDYKETEFNKKTYDNYYYGVNLNQNILTSVHIWSDEEFKKRKEKDDEWDKDFPDFANQDTPQKINTRSFQITAANEDIIVAEGQFNITIATISHNFYKKITVDIKKKQVTEYLEKFSTIDNRKLSTQTSIYQCEGDFSGTSGDIAGTSGTAFFINRKGHLLTNNHVVESCEVSKINYFNKEYETSLISTDKTLDLALLKVDLKPKSFISFSNKEQRKRQLVIVAGYPLGEYLSDDLKINEGKISSLKGFENNSNEITVDLAINPGNSGGPIVDENGQLVAVAVAGMSKDVTEGISFGIKSSAVINFLKTNKISPDIKLTSFSMNDEKVNQLLEESTVYIFCEK